MIVCDVGSKTVKLRSEYMIVANVFIFGDAAARFVYTTVGHC